MSPKRWPAAAMLYLACVLGCGGRPSAPHKERPPLLVPHSVWQRGGLRPAQATDTVLIDSMLAMVRYPSGHDLEIHNGSAVLPVEDLCDVYNCDFEYPPNVRIQQTHILHHDIFVCSASFIAEDRILTAGHCVARSTEKLCRTYFVMRYAQTASAGGLVVDLNHLLRPVAVEHLVNEPQRGPDWAIVRVAPVGTAKTIPPHSILPPLATDRAAPGTPTVVPSHLGGLSLMLADGELSVPPTDRPNDGRMLWGRFDSSGGASGAPVLDARREHTLAIVRGNNFSIHPGGKRAEVRCDDNDLDARCLERLTPADTIQRTVSTHTTSTKERLQCPSPTP